MSGALKSGLIFALVGLAGGVGFSFITIGGPLWGIPVTLVVGALAGYYGVRWGAESAGVGTGVLAGTIAGVGALAGAVIAWVIAIDRARSLPGFEEVMREQIQRQQPDAQATPEQINALIGISGPLVGVCCGVVELVLALALGALGGWLAARGRTRQTMPPAAPPPPFGPPPMSPPS
jgi:hypothetical protein